MSKARTLADLLDSNGDVVSGALDNVPPSNDASALTTGTLPIARIADGDVTTAKLASTLDLSGKTVTLAAGGTGYGKVLQEQHVRLTSLASASGTTDTGTGANLGLSLSITPKASGSHFYITVSIGIGSTASGNSWVGILSRNGTRVHGTGANGHPRVWFRGVDHTGGSGTDPNHGVGASASYMDTTGSVAGTPITFMCGFAGEGGDVQINYVESNYSGSAIGAHNQTESIFTVMEIAQ